MTFDALPRAEATLSAADLAAAGVDAFPGPLRIRPLRDAVAAGLVVLVVSALGLGVTYYFARRAQLDAVRNELLQVARIAATRVDLAAHQRLDRPELELGPEYRRTLAPLVDLLRATDDVIYIYTGVLRDGRVRFVLDTAAVYRRPGDTTPPGHLMEEYSGADADFARALMSQAAVINAEPQVDEYGYFLSAYAPMRDAAGRFAGVVGADMRVQAVEERVNRVWRIAVAAGAGMAMLSLLIGAGVHRMRVASAAAKDRNWTRLRELAVARDAAEQSGRAKSTFVAMMSHELRTPLNAIVGYSELMHEDLVARGQARLAADIGRVRTAGRHLAAIINDILDYSKLEADRLVLMPENVDVRELLRDVHADVQADAASRGLHCVVEVAPGVESLRVDPVRLRQVLTNLATNAVKFTEHGRVVLRARPAPGRAGHVVFLVHDTGLGIPPDKRHRLFQPFSQVDGSLTRRAGGTGLGLVICERLVRALGGSLRVRSRVGRGSTFRVRLPVAAAAPGASR